MTRRLAAALVAFALGCATFTFAVPTMAQEAAQADSVPAADDTGTPPTARETAPSTPETEAETPEETSSDSEPRAERQPPGPSAPTEQPLEDRTREQLSEEGFVFGSSRAGRGSTRATLVAMTAGLVVHGAGHFVADDRRTAYFLLTMEGVGLAFAATGLLSYGASGGADPFSGLAATSVYFGTGLFALSYLFDVLGTVAWGNPRAEAGQARDGGISLDLRYRLFQTDALPLLHTGSAGVAADYGWIAASAGTTQEVGLLTSMYEAAIALRPLRLEESRTWAGVSGSFDRVSFSGTGRFIRTGVEGSIGGQFDLRTLFPHLWGFAVGSKVGLGRQWFTLVSSATNVASSHIPFDIYGDYRWDENIEMRAGYRRSESMLIPSSGRLRAVPYLRGSFRTGRRVDLLLGLEYGDGPVFDAGLRIWVL